MNGLSHTTGYAIVALSFVGAAGGKWVQAQEIARRTGIPKPYLSKILHALGKAGLIRTKRGTGGGVSLSRPAGAMSLLEVAMAVDPTVTQPRCFMGMASCSDTKPCPMHAYWKQTREEIHRQLARTTLADVAEFESAADFKAASPQQLLDELPGTRRVYRGKPTARFGRKFGPPKR